MRSNNSASSGSLARPWRCAKCGRRPPLSGKRHCKKCTVIFRKAAKLWAKKRKAKGLQNHSTERNRIIRVEGISRYGGKCAQCGESQFEFLTIDHIGGGGSAHRKSLGNRGSGGFFRWLRRQGWPVGYRVLCYNCNMGGAIKERRLRSRSATSIYRERIKREAMNAYGGLLCACCGCDDADCLTIDHANGDGAKHRREIGKGVGLYYWLRRHGWPKGFQVLCFSCNCAKRGGKECPHAKSKMVNGVCPSTD